MIPQGSEFLQKWTSIKLGRINRRAIRNFTRRTALGWRSLAFESVPILVADVAVVSLVWNYEKAYCQRIEENRDTLRNVGMSQLSRLLDETKDQIRAGTFADSTALRRDLREVLSLINSQAKIRRYHQWLLLLLCLAAFASIGASYAPTLVLVPSATFPLTLIIAALGLSAAVFVACYWFHERIQWLNARVPAEHDQPRV